MELRVFRLFLTCYLTCTLCRCAISGSTLTEVFSIINNTSQSDTRKSEIGNTGTERSIVTEMRLDEIILKDDQSKIEIPHLSTVTSDFKKAKCSRYCIEQLENNKGFEDINLFWLFADQQNEEEYFSIENSPNLKIFRYRSSDNKNSTILDNCRIYLNLNCDIINKERNLITQNKLYLNSEFNQQREKFKNYFSNTTPEFSKILVHTPNLSGYTETNFQVDTNVIELIINIFGNFSAVITIPINRTIERPGMVMSSASIYNEKGVAIGARNLPGRWCVKLTGVENSKYDFYVIAYYKASEENRKNNIINTNSTNEINRKTDFDTYEAFDKKHMTTENKASTIINETNFNEMKQIRENTIDGTNSMFLINHTMNRKPKFARSTKIIVSTSNDKTMAGDFSDTSFFSHESSAAENINYFLHNNSLMSYGDFQILPNATSIKQQQKIQARSSEVASLNEDTEDAKMKSSMSEIVPMQMTNSDQSQKLSTQFAKINDDPFERRKILLEINANSKLIAIPGTTHRVVFDATNSCILPVRYAIRARSSPLRIVNMQPSYYMWLYPGQTDQVAVDILVPLTSQDTVNTLTLFIDGTEISEKTVNVLVQNTYSKNIDNVKPTIEYSFNSNCAGKLDKDRCEKTLWSADITVQDYDSGLKRVISIPNGIYPHTKYISGTKDRVTFYYSSTCCTTTATITAIDISENQHTRTIDVTQWDNLSQGEIAAIVLGALFLLLLLILLIVAIVYCFRRKNSHDLPYTQRYGSRQPPRSERTSF